MNPATKNILHLIATNFYGGPEKQIVEHLKRLDSTQYRGTVASFLEGGKGNEILERASREGLPHHGIPMNGRLDARALWRLIRLLKQERFDLLCTHGYKATIMGWLAGKILNIPVLAFSRGYTGENRTISFYEWLERQIIGRTQGTICVSHGQRKKLKDLGVRLRRSWVVHNAVSVNGLYVGVDSDLRSRVLERLGLPQGTRLVVTAGRLSPEKGHRYLVEAIAKLGAERDGTTFVFCGDGVCRGELETLAGQLGVSAKCHFVGFRKDLDEVFRIMNFSVLPSLTEGLPNVVLESFAHGKPVVASAVGGVPEIVRDRINGLLVPPSKPLELAEAIRVCLESPDEARSMGEAARRAVESDFTFEAQTQQLQRIYRTILDEHQ